MSAESYAGRVEQTQALTEQLAHLSPQEIGLALIEEAETVAHAYTSSEERLRLEYRLLMITDPAAREAASRQAALSKQQTVEEAQAKKFSDGLDEWLGQVIQVGKPAEHEDQPAEKPFDPLAEYKLEEAAIEKEAARQQEKADESLQLLAELDSIVFVTGARIELGEAPDGQEWRGSHTIDAVKRIMGLQDKLGMPMHSDTVRQLLRDSVEPVYYVHTIPWLIKNAERADDREAFLLAAARFNDTAERRPTSVTALAEPLVRCAIHFINSTKPAHLDRDALEIALAALPYQERIQQSYPLLCARLGASLLGFNQGSDITN